MRRSSFFLIPLCLLAVQSLSSCSSHTNCSQDSTCGDHNVANQVSSPSQGKGTPPLKFTVDETDPWDVCAGGSGKVYLKAPALTEVSQHINESKALTTAQRSAFDKQLAQFDGEHEGVPADYILISLTLQGASGQAVVVPGVTVNVVDVKPTPQNSLRIAGGGGCGGANYSTFLLNLDKPDPRPTFKQGEMADGKMRSRGFPVQVAENDTETLSFIAFTTAGIHDFTLGVKWASEGRTGIVKVTATGGRPFVVASGVKGRKYDCQFQDGSCSPRKFTFDPKDPLGNALPIVE